MPMREATPGSEPDLIVFGPHQPVPYTLTPQAEEELDADAEADWAHEWDDADSAVYQARVEAGLEPEAEL